MNEREALQEIEQAIERAAEAARTVYYDNELSLGVWRLVARAVLVAALEQPESHPKP